MLSMTFFLIWQPNNSPDLSTVSTLPVWVSSFIRWSFMKCIRCQVYHEIEISHLWAFFHEAYAHLTHASFIVVLRQTVFLPRVTPTLKEWTEIVMGQFGTENMGFNKSLFISGCLDSNLSTAFHQLGYLKQVISSFRVGFSICKLGAMMLLLIEMMWEWNETTYEMGTVQFRVYSRHSILPEDVNSCPSLTTSHWALSVGS